MLEESTIDEMSSPHTQKDSPWGYNGYNLWVTGDTLEKLRTGEQGLWVVGGYEGTYCWIDTKRELVGMVMTQMFRMKLALRIYSVQPSSGSFGRKRENEKDSTLSVK